MDFNNAELCGKKYVQFSIVWDPVTLIKMVLQCHFWQKNAEELAKIRNKKIWDDLSNLEGKIQGKTSVCVTDFLVIYHEISSTIIIVQFKYQIHV